jgi:hypothetical protein
MAAYVAQSGAADDEDRSSEELGQRHDRIPGYTAGDDGDIEDEIDITGVQKMLSAVSGSLLTSVLGTFPNSPPFTVL